MLLAAGVHDVVGCDRHGRSPRARTTPTRRPTPCSRTGTAKRGTADEVLERADVYIGLSGPGAVSPEAVRTMADGAIVFAMANPNPEVAPEPSRMPWP